MQNVKFTDNQRVKRDVVQMWFKLHGNNFHVAGTKTDLDSLRRDLRKLAQAHIKGTKNGKTAKSVLSLFLVKRKGLQRINPNPSVHSFYNRLLLESGLYIPV